MCDKAVDDYPAAFKLIPWSFTSQTIKKTFYCFVWNENILYFNEDTVQSFDGLDIL